MLKGTDIPILGKLLAFLFGNVIRESQSKPLPKHLRQLVSFSQPFDPLQQSEALPIGIVIPCHQKDFSNLNLVIAGATNTIRNPIKSITVVTPGAFRSEIEYLFPEIDVIPEETVIGQVEMDFLMRLPNANRRGWFLQQLLKLKTAINAKEQASLILDADTVLLRERTWINQKKVQIICIAEEFHLPYKQCHERYFGSSQFPWSFTTHHQLMQQDFLQEMFGPKGERLLNWLLVCDFALESPISDYESYGEWITQNHPERMIYAKWNNQPIRIQNKRIGFEEFRGKFSPEICSVSMHSYL